jgi:nitroimidazol reductase NimA-like FMN-containing flavoprotein (pyridoxamine 5'-phosphate oxidase superfamily)
VSTEERAAPDKLPASAIFALLDGAPFGRLATYAPPTGAHPGHCYVVPLQFLHREGRIYIITRPGRKLRNLQAAPRGVCFQLDLTEGAGWTSVCAWGDYHDVDQLRDRLNVLSASFTKYPDRTTHQAVSWLRSHTPRLGHLTNPAAAQSFVIGCLALTSVSGRFWPGRLLSAGPRLVHPTWPVVAVLHSRGRPVRLDLPACWEVLRARPLAHLGCYHPARERTYCLPLWFAIEGRDLWFYHPGGGQALVEALREHPHGVCAQVDDLDCSPAADPGQPWRSVVAEGSAAVFALDAGSDAELPPARRHEILRAIRHRLHDFAIESMFVPPDPDLAPPTGFLLRLRIQVMGGQATGNTL